MSQEVGLWIDHSKAVIVFLSAKDEEIKQINSDIEEHRGQSADDARQKAETGHLNIFYDGVIACTRDAKSILILGPGEAKGELKKRLEHDNLSRPIVEIQAEDKMTNPQIVALVRSHFLNKRAAATPS